MGWKDTLDEAIIAADLRRARRPVGVGWYGRMRLTSALDAAAKALGRSLPVDLDASQLQGIEAPTAATVELLQHARLGGRARGLSREAVGALYWRVHDKKPRGSVGPKRVVMIATGVIAVGAVIAAVVGLTSGPPAPTEAAPTTEGRLAPADEEAWVGALTAWAVALDALSANRSEGSTAREARELTARVRALREKATTTRPGSDLGPEVTAALETFMNAAEASSRPGRSLSHEDEDIATTLRAVNRALAVAKRPYFVDHAMLLPSADRIQIAAFVFYIEDTRRFRGPDGIATAHVVRRIDTLSVQQALLGYTKANMDVALVRADKIADTAKERLASALVAGGPITLPLPAGADSEAWAALMATAGAVLRTALGDDPRDLQSLAARYAVAVMGHEAQHRVDYDGPRLAIPAEIKRLAHGDAEFAEHTARELSAYTAELVHDPAWAKLGVMNLLAHLASGSTSGEAVSAAMILSGLGESAGEVGAPLSAGSAADVARAVTMAARIVALSDADLVKAASELWAKWFGRPLQTLTAQ